MEREDQPGIVVIGGPNGAGKSTTAPLLLRGALAVDEFVNADVIARGLSAFQPEGAAVAAGKAMLERLRLLAARGASFAFETTLASLSLAPWLREQKLRGYRAQLVYLWLPSEAFALARVVERVRSGGHAVPEATVRRRYRRGIRNLFEVYQPIADGWRVYDNARPAGPRLIARGQGTMLEVIDSAVWSELLRSRDREP